jgi:hypothetical protein
MSNKKIQKIKGLNDKEQRLLEVLADTKPYTLKQLRELFRHISTRHLRKTRNQRPQGWNTNLQAHSYVRNSIRKLVRHGWVKRVDTGTYELTNTGKTRLKSGVCVTEGPSLQEYYEIKKSIELSNPDLKPQKKTNS